MPPDQRTRRFPPDCAGSAAAPAPFSPEDRALRSGRCEPCLQIIRPAHRTLADHFGIPENPRTRTRSFRFIS